MSSKVYFSRNITPDELVRLYDAVGVELSGRIAIKVHSGEVGNQNFLRPEFFRPVIERVGGTVVECNTAYRGGRDTTERHLDTFRLHGWVPTFDVDLLDAEGPDLELEIPEGVEIKRNFVGRDIVNYDSALILSHFKGHPMGGYGGAIKQLSIGFASSYGKKYIHGVGDTDNFWNSDHDSFLRAMADAALSVTRLFGERIVYINVMKNLSVDCDCCAKAEDPCMSDIGVLASLDPVAIDRACLDLVYNSTDVGRDHFVKRVESLNGTLTPIAAEKLGIGSLDYELIEI